MGGVKKCKIRSKRRNKPIIMIFHEIQQLQFIIYIIIIIFLKLLLPEYKSL